MQVQRFVHVWTALHFQGRSGLQIRSNRQKKDRYHVRRHRSAVYPNVGGSVGTKSTIALPTALALINSGVPPLIMAHRRTVTVDDKTLQGSDLDDGSIIFDPTGIDTFSGTLSGHDDITWEGSGTLVIDGGKGERLRRPRWCSS
jgi:hypothetical protein